MKWPLSMCNHFCCSILQVCDLCTSEHLWTERGRYGQGFHSLSTGYALQLQGVGKSSFVLIWILTRESARGSISIHLARDMSDRLSIDVDNARSLGILRVLEIIFDIKLAHMMSWHLISPRRSHRKKSAYFASVLNESVDGSALINYSRMHLKV